MQERRTTTELDEFDGLYLSPVPDEISPPAELAIRRRRRSTDGRCYELAFLYLREHGESEASLRLVHGTINGSLRLGHAWVESDQGVLFDAVNQAFYDAGEYYARRHCREIARFTLDGAIRQIAATGIYGPWHGERVK
jgi:hypothetical protein